MVDHAWVQENLDIYLTGDLTTDERENVVQHIAACEACKQALAEARQLEHVMKGLFADARPDATWEERMIQEVRKEPVRTLQRPTLWRFAAAAAAVLVVGLVGFAAQAINGDGGFTFGDAPVTKVRQNLKGDLGGKVRDTVETRMAAAAAMLEKEIAEQQGMVQVQVAAGQIGTPPTGTITPYQNKLATITEPAPSVPEDDANKPAPDLGPRKLSNPGEKGKGGEGFDKRKDVFYDTFDSPLRPTRPNKEEFAKEVHTKKKSFDFGRDSDEGKKALEQLDKDQKREYPFIDPSKSIAMDKPSATPPPLPTPPVFDDGIKSKLFPAMQPPSLAPAAPSPPGYFGPPPPVAFPAFPDAKEPDGGGKGDSKDKELPPDKGKKKPEPKVEPKQVPVEPPIETNRKIIRTGEMEFEIDSFDKAVEKITQLVAGEIKNKVVLLPAIPGGFIATINSDKLPNGKMRGSIVVRMPPQFLDKFVQDLRSEMAKSGELKNQRIISIDVTKQYTDIESRLRAARTMEERLIQIIKNSKGEIKDLVAAERELGIWRTKIEEMEGEIRYYANQVSLSTLTISLYEKEILAPTAIVVTETVRMRLEVEDVAKAHQTAMNLVVEMDGRLTKSELKQHSAGQLQSIICAEIPPKNKDAFRDKLKALGILSMHEENQSQHTEGGTGKGSELKPRSSDVHFDVTMHNTANVRPRLSADLKVATSDVPAAYAKLLDAIAAANGQVRDGKLNEQDKLNITAILDFNVPTTARPKIDELIESLGPILERINIQAPISELSTARKFGYTLLLRDFASIPPSKAVIEVIATANVPAAYGELVDAIADVKVKGQLADAKLNEQDKLNVNAQLDFTVLTEKKGDIDKLVKKLQDVGASLSHTNVQAPLKQLSTSRKFGYTIVLRDFVGVPPSKATELKVATTDVPAKYAMLLTAIGDAKGQIADAKLNEQDKLHITAQFAFTVPSEKAADMDKRLIDLGAVLSRNNTKAAVNQLATDKKFGFTLDLRDFVNIPPSHASALMIAASNVPGNYTKLLEEIATAEGQVRDAKLNVQDKLNVTGQIDFTVPKEKKGRIEELLGKIGSMLSRNNVQAPVTELSTDRKFGYSVILRDFANIPARETFILQLAMNDVPTTFREFQQAVTKAKGWVSVGKLVEDNKAKIEAEFDFDVPAAEKATIEALIIKAGAVVSRTSSQIPVNELATDQKVGYRVNLRSSASIPPREKVWVKFEVTDVDGEATRLKDMVLAANGRVVDSSIERYENGQAAAAMIFEVAFASQDALLRQMKAGGVKLVSQKTTRNPQVSENELTTTHIIVTLAGADPILPSDKGVGSYVHNSLYLSFQILSVIVMTVIVGLSAIVPCAIVIWIGVKLYAFMTGPSSQGRPAPLPTRRIAEGDKPADSDPPAKL